MGLREALDAARPSKRADRCRICTLIDTLPQEDSAYLAEAIRPGSGVSFRQLVQALEMEYGESNLYHSAKHHRYVCDGGKA